MNLLIILAVASLEEVRKEVPISGLVIKALAHWHGYSPLDLRD